MKAQNTAPFSAKFLQKVDKVNDKMLCSLSRGAEHKDVITWTFEVKGKTTL